jgi:hypothetical protein
MDLCPLRLHVFLSSILKLTSNHTLVLMQHILTFNRLAKTMLVKKSFLEEVAELSIVLVAPLLQLLVVLLDAACVLGV